MKFKIKPALLLPAIFLLVSSCANYQSVLQKPRINDGVVYGRKPLPVSERSPWYFNENGGNIELPDLNEWAGDKAVKKYDSVDEFLEASRSTALLVVRNDTIIFEKYFNGYKPEDITQIFSVTKPLTVSLLSIALEEGRIQSVDTPVSEFFSVGRRKKKSGDLTLRHLGQMRSGFNHSDYWRFFKVIRFYHAKDADDYIQKVKVFRDPGKKYRYKSIDTQVLGHCMEKIFDEPDLMSRFVDLYWNNIGPEHDGFFSIDHPDSENLKYYGGLNISARDLAKIGKIYLNDGMFEEQQVLPESWMNFIADTSNHVGRWDYGMGWYFDEMAEGRNVFYGSGFNGQLLVINKDTNSIVIRMGEAKSGHEWYHLMSELSTLF